MSDMGGSASELRFSFDADGRPDEVMTTCFVSLRSVLLLILADVVPRNGSDDLCCRASSA